MSVGEDTGVSKSALLVTHFRFSYEASYGV